MAKACVRISARAFLALCALSLFLAIGTRAQDVVVGTIDKVDTGTKTIAVKTADGTVTVVKYTGDTTLAGLKDGAHCGDLVGKEGSHIIVHEVPDGADKVAHAVTYVGDATVHTTEGTVFHIGKKSKTIGVKTADGTVKTFSVAKHATIDGGKDVYHYSSVKLKQGDHLVVYSTEEGGKELAHAFKHL